MTQVCFYFQIHQPFRLREYSFFNIGHDHAYQAVQQNYFLMDRIAQQCYLPAASLLLEQIRLQDKKFKVSFSISGTALEQFERYCPKMIEVLNELLETGCVELLSETYYHSLAGLYSFEEFERQVLLHKAMLLRLFDYEPTSFRNTELIFTDEIAGYVAKLGYKTMLVEGLNLTDNQEDTCVFQATSAAPLLCLPRHGRLSDDIGFRFGNADWIAHPLTAQKYASWIAAAASAPDGFVGLYMDFETFGEHKNAETGIFDFLEQLPAELLSLADIEFVLPRELAEKTINLADLPFYGTHGPVSWAGHDKDISAWTQAHIQKDALDKIYAMQMAVLLPENIELLDTWGQLQTSDHFYYMSTRYWADPVHRSLNPYPSPYDAYINFMNVVSDFEKRLKKQI